MRAPSQKKELNTVIAVLHDALSLDAAEWRQSSSESCLRNNRDSNGFCEITVFLTIIALVRLMAFDWVQDDVPMAGPSFMQRVQNAMRDDDVPAPRGPTISTMTAPTTASVAPRDILPIEERPIIQQLMQHWLNERAAPEVLPCRLDLLNDILEKLSDQVLVFQLSCCRRR